MITITTSKFNIGQQVRHKLLGYLGVIVDVDAEYSLKFIKFSIGQQVRHKLLGYLGVIVDVDAEYSLDKKPQDDDIAANLVLRSAPWYHVVMEDDNGEHIHTYLAEAHITYETSDEHPEHLSLDELSEYIKNKLKEPQLRH